jgi:hypothetical protein
VFGEGDQRVDIVGGDGNALGLVGDSGIARGAPEFLTQRRGGDRPAQRVLAAARSDNKDCSRPPDPTTRIFML